MPDRPPSTTRAWVLSAVLTVVMLGGLWVVNRLGHAVLGDHSIGNVVLPVVWLAAWIAALRLWARRQMGREQYDLLRQALRDGELPVGADTHDWRPRLVAVRRGAEWRGVVRVVMVVVVGAMGLLLVVTLLLARDANGRPPPWPLLALVVASLVVMVAVTVWGRRRSRRTERNAERLLRQIDRDERGPGRAV